MVTFIMVQSLDMHILNTNSRAEAIIEKFVFLTATESSLRTITDNVFITWELLRVLIMPFPR